jgi:hypothetical protein
VIGNGPPLEVHPLLAFFDTEGGREVLSPVIPLVILAALWAVVLLPPVLRSRSERTNDSIGDFNYRLDALGRTNGALRPGVVHRVTPAQRATKRRRDVVRVLLVAVGGSGLVALGTNASIAWAAFAISAMAFAGFCALWAWARSIQAERAIKVRSLPHHHTPELALRRAASS